MSIENHATIDNNQWENLSSVLVRVLLPYGRNAYCVEGFNVYNDNMPVSFCLRHPPHVNRSSDLSSFNLLEVYHGSVTTRSATLID